MNTRTKRPPPSHDELFESPSKKADHKYISSLTAIQEKAVSPANNLIALVGSPMNKPDLKDVGGKTCKLFWNSKFQAAMTGVVKTQEMESLQKVICICLTFSHRS